MTHDDGGPAFPGYETFMDHDPRKTKILSKEGKVVTFEGTPPTCHDVRYPGMSLRDYLAGQALVGLLSNPNNFGTEGGNPAPTCVAAFVWADAMIAIREAGES